jgi:hypothetical protein
MSANRSQALEAEIRLILRDTQRALDTSSQEILQGAAAQGFFNSGGTVRRLVNALLDQGRIATDKIIDAHARSGIDDPEMVASATRGSLQPIVDSFFSTHANRNVGAWPTAFQSMRPECDQLLSSITDKATVALANYPRSTDDVIGQRVPVPLPASWDRRVGRALQKARDQLSKARDEEDFQLVGTLCREVIISAAQEVYALSRHPPLDSTIPSETDAKRKLEAYFAAELAGGPVEAIRKHARSALDLANAVQHKRTATFRDAGVCLEATSSVVTMVVIVAGTRGLP